MIRGWKHTDAGLFVPESVDTSPRTCVAPGPLGDPGPSVRREIRGAAVIGANWRGLCDAPIPDHARVHSPRARSKDSCEPRRGTPNPLPW